MDFYEDIMQVSGLCSLYTRTVPDPDPAFPKKVLDADSDSG
jgi:hypothetical protein